MLKLVNDFSAEPEVISGKNNLVKQKTDNCYYSPQIILQSFVENVYSLTQLRV